MNKFSAMLFSVGSVLCWSISPVLIRYIKDLYSVSFQNFFRFSISIVIIWIFTLVSIGWKKTFLSIRDIQNPVPKLMLIAFLNFLHQFFFVKGIYMLLPGLASILQESSIIFSAVLAFVFFPGERKLILQPLFITGLLLSIIGVVMTTIPEMTGSMLSADSSAGKGVLYILAGSLCWAFFGVLVKLWLPDAPSSVISSLVFTLVIPFFLAGMLLSGSPGVLQANTPASAWLLLIISGIIGIGIAYPLYYKSIKVLGVTFTSSMGLMTPVIAAGISFFILSESLQAVQIAGAGILLAGCYLIIRIRFRT